MRRALVALLGAWLVAAGCGGGESPPGGSPTAGSGGSGGRGGASGSAGSGGRGGAGGSTGGGGGTAVPTPGLDASGGQPPVNGPDGPTTDGGVDGAIADTNAGPEAAAGDGPAITLPRMVIRHDLRPSDTDPAIDKWPDNHVAVVDGRAPLQGKLFLFLPGGNGAPAGTVDMLNEAASYGFHTLGLMFATDELVGDDCPGDPDPACAGKMRTEVIEGEDLSRHLEVSRANSIENRAGKALAHLAQRWPAEGWGQYVDGTTARWSQIIVAGRSLGGAVSARIGMLRAVHRVEIHSAPGDSLANGQPAPWLRETSKTPPDRFFAFSHTGDPDYRSFTQNWAALGIPGPPANVDSMQPPYGGSHQLITSAPPPGGAGGAHGATTAGGGSPRAGGGYRYAPVWRYMMGVAP